MRAAGRLGGHRVIGVDAAVCSGLVHHAQLPVEQVVRERGIDAGHGGALGKRAAIGSAATTARHAAGELGLVMVQPQATGEQPLLAELQGIERIRRFGGGLAVAVGVVAAPGQAGGVDRGVIDVRRGPGAAVEHRDAGGRQFFAGQLDAGAERVLHRDGVERRGEVGLVGEDSVGVVLERGVAARHGPAGRVGRVGRGQVGGAVHEGGQQVVLMRPPPAGSVVQRGTVGEIVLDAQRRHVGLDVVVVGIGAVEVFGIDARGAVQPWPKVRVGAAVAGQADGRHAAVGHVVLLHVQQVQVDAGRRAQAEGQRRRDAPAVVLDMVAAADAAILAQHVETKTGVLADRLVPVGGDPFAVRVAVGHRARDGIRQERLLADHVDRAAGRGAAVVGAGGAFLHFDLLDIEHVAGDGAEVAHAVDEDAAGGVEAAHVDGIAGGSGAVLAGIEGAHARAVAQCLGQRGGALLLDQFLGDHADGLRGVQQRLGVFRRGQLVDAVVVAGDRFHLHAGQALGLRHLRAGEISGRGIRGGRGESQRQAGEQGCRLQRARRRGLGARADGMFARFDRCHESSMDERDLRADRAWRVWRMQGLALAGCRVRGGRTRTEENQRASCRSTGNNLGWRNVPACRKYLAAGEGA